MATASGDTEMTRMLLEAGAAVDMRAHGGRTPMGLAIEADHVEVVDLLELAGTS